MELSLKHTKKQNSKWCNLLWTSKLDLPSSSGAVLDLLECRGKSADRTVTQKYRREAKRNNVSPIDPTKKLHAVGSSPLLFLVFESAVLYFEQYHIFPDNSTLKKIFFLKVPCIKKKSISFQICSDSSRNS